MPLSDERILELIAEHAEWCADHNWINFARAIELAVYDEIARMADDGVRITFAEARALRQPDQEPK